MTQAQNSFIQAFLTPSPPRSVCTHISGKQSHSVKWSTWRSKKPKRIHVYMHTWLICIVICIHLQWQCGGIWLCSWEAWWKAEILRPKLNLLPTSNRTNTWLSAEMTFRSPVSSVWKKTANFALSDLVRDLRQSCLQTCQQILNQVCLILRWSEFLWAQNKSEN